MQRMKMLLNRRHIIKIGKHRTAEVNPVNTPWIAIIASIGVFYILWQNKKFVGTNLVSGFADLIPSISIDTIEYKIFRKTFFPISVMACRVRVITQAADV